MHQTFLSPFLSQYGYAHVIYTSLYKLYILYASLGASGIIVVYTSSVTNLLYDILISAM